MKDDDDDSAPTTPTVSLSDLATYIVDGVQPDLSEDETEAEDEEEEEGEEGP